MQYQYIYYTFDVAELYYQYLVKIWSNCCYFMNKTLEIETPLSYNRCVVNYIDMSPWSSGQDASLSRWNQGFDSPWRYQITPCNAGRFFNSFKKHYISFHRYFSLYPQPFSVMIYSLPSLFLPSFFLMLDIFTLKILLSSLT